MNIQGERQLIRPVGFQGKIGIGINKGGPAASVVEIEVKLTAPPSEYKLFVPIEEGVIKLFRLAFRKADFGKRQGDKAREARFGVNTGTLGQKSRRRHGGEHRQYGKRQQDNDRPEFHSTSRSIW